LGIYSRLILLPFDHEFSAEDPDFDPHIEDKLTSPEALSYLLNLALAGLERLTRRNQFTISERSALKLEAYRIGQSYPLAWAAEEDIDVAYLTEAKTTEELYSEYQDWHVRSGLQYPVSLRTFHSEMEKRFGLIRKRVKNITTGGKYRYRFYLEEK